MSAPFVPAPRSPVQVARDLYLQHAEHCPEADCRDGDESCPECVLLLSILRRAHRERASGTFYIAPAGNRCDEYSAGYDGNVFLYRDEAEREVARLADAIGGEWTVEVRS